MWDGKRLKRLFLVILEKYKDYSMFKPNGSQPVKLEKGTKEGRNVVSQQNRQTKRK